MSLITSPQAVNFGGSPTFRRFSYFSYTLFLSKRTSCIFNQKKNYGNYNKRKTNVRLVSSCLMDDSLSCSGSSSNSPGEMIEIFYKCINEKNLKEMSTYISEDCLIEDTLFSEKFKGKKAAMSFIEKLTESMGPDMKFRIREVYERPPFMARAIWHLEWRNMEIPLAYGCTFIDIKDEERKTIQMVQIITELKLKAGHLLLAIMKLMTLLLAKHPTILEWLTKVSPQRWVKKISRSVYFSSGISWKAF